MSLNYMVAKYKLILTELFHPQLHGDIPYLFSHYLNFLNITPYELYQEYPQEYSVLGKNPVPSYPLHPIIKNYHHIIKKKGHIHLDIVLPIRLETGESVCILKTFWLHIFQRKYKQYYKKKMAFFKNPKSLMIRELQGKWERNNLNK